MNKSNLRILFILFLYLSACGGQNQEASTSDQTDTSENSTSEAVEELEVSYDDSYVGYIEQAHQKHEWYKHSGISCNMYLEFGGKKRFEGKMIMMTHAGKTRMEADDGRIMIFDGTNAYIAPDTISYPDARVRFDVLTWPYFLAAPFKFGDPGVKIDTLGTKTLFDEEYDTAKLTFTQDVGDTPDDWYILYRNLENNQLRAMAYIVTYGKTNEEANADPHMISYDVYADINGVPIPVEWRFWEWNEETGEGNQIGLVKLSGVQFVEISEDIFEAPENSRTSQKPSPAKPKEKPATKPKAETES